MITYEDFEKESLSWVDTPYGIGAVKNQRCSCTGLLLGICRDLGIRYWKEFEIYENRARPEDFVSLLKLFRRFAFRVNYENRRPLDLLMFRIDKKFQHVAILLRNDIIVEADDTLGKVTCRQLSVKPFFVFRVPESDQWLNLD